MSSDPPEQKPGVTVYYRHEVRDLNARVNENEALALLSKTSRVVEALKTYLQVAGRPASQRFLRSVNLDVYAGLSRIQRRLELGETDYRHLTSEVNMALPVYIRGFFDAKESLGAIERAFIAATGKSMWQYVRDARNAEPTI